MKRLEPKAVWLFFIQNSIGWILFILFTSSCFIFPFIMSFIEDRPSRVNSFGTIGLLYIVGLIVVSVFIILLCYVIAKLTYSNYKYELKDDGFYKESGVITKKYVTIPYERIQNVDINRGIVARLLGLSDLHIQTAGMSASYGKYGAYGVGAEGRLPALSEADALTVRDELIKRAKGKKDQGGL